MQKITQYAKIGANLEQLNPLRANNMPISDDISLKVRQAAAEGNLEFLISVFGKNGDEAGANINAAGPSTGNTALHQAAIFNQPEVAQFLVRVKGAQLLKNLKGETAFDCAMQIGAIEVMRFITDKFGTQPTTSHVVPDTDLVHQLGSEYYVELEANLKNYTVDQILQIAREKIPTGKQYMGFTLLQLVVMYSKNVEAVKAVAKLGNDHNTRAAFFQFMLSQNTPLHYFLTTENIDAALSFTQFLLLEGKQIDFTVRNIEGRTTLLLAAKARSARAVEILLNFGAHVALLMPDIRGRNLLHTACILGDVATVNVLRNTNAFRELLDGKDYQGKSPVDLLDMSIANTRAFIRSTGIYPDRNESTSPSAPKTLLETCLEGRTAIRDMILAMQRTLS